MVDKRTRVPGRVRLRELLHLLQRDTNRHQPPVRLSKVRSQKPHRPANSAHWRRYEKKLSQTPQSISCITKFSGMQTVPRTTSTSTINSSIMARTWITGRLSAVRTILCLRCPLRPNCHMTVSSSNSLNPAGGVKVHS